MNVTAYLSHIPAIEKAIVDHRLDTLVCGMGPTAWLLPWMDRSVLAPLRMWGCHDACRILPMDDLVVMDSPHGNREGQLHPDTSRYAELVKARPKRLWIYSRNAPSWKGHIHPCMEKVTQLVEWDVCDPGMVPRLLAQSRKRSLDDLPFKLEAKKPQTTAISPTGMTTLAWREGCRRIGVLGVDMMKNHHHTYRSSPLVDVFFVRMAEQAHARGGCVVNLSPVTSLTRFKAWTSSTSGSAPISGSETQAPSASSSTPSTSTPPATSTSTG